MRVRIVKAMAGILDGQSLSVFRPHNVYDVDERLAVQLIDLGGAVEDISKTRAIRPARPKKPATRGRKKQSRKQR